MLFRSVEYNNAVRDLFALPAVDVKPLLPGDETADEIRRSTSRERHDQLDGLVDAGLGHRMAWRQRRCGQGLQRKLMILPVRKAE